MKKILILSFTIIGIFLSIQNGFSQRKFAMKTHNFVQINETEFRFDVSIKNNSTNPTIDTVAIAGMQFQIAFNTSMLNGGGFNPHTHVNNRSLAYITGSSEMRGTKNLPSNALFTCVGSGTILQWGSASALTGEIVTCLTDNNWKRIGTFKVRLANSSTSIASANYHNFRSVLPNLQFVTTANFCSVNHCYVDYDMNGDGEFTRQTMDAFLITGTDKTLYDSVANTPLYGYAFTQVGNYGDAARWNNTLPAGHPNRNVVPNSLDSSVSIGTLTTANPPVESRGVCLVNIDANVNNLFVRSGSLALPTILTIDSAKTLKVNVNAYTPDDYTHFILNAMPMGSGNFICSTPNIKATVNRWMNSNGTSYWNYLSTPVASLSSSIFTTASPSRSLYYPNEPTNTYISINAVPENLTIMRGYGRKCVSGELYSDWTIPFTGVLNTGNQSIPLTRTASQPDANEGWNLLGNPYPCALDWQSVTGWTKTNIDNGIYMTTGTGTYASYIDGVGTNGGTQFIPSMQGFWVRVAAGQTNGSLAVNNDAKAISSQNLYKSNNDDNYLRLKITSKKNLLSDETVIRFNNNATDNFDGQFDAYKWLANDEYNIPQIFTIAGAEKLSINTQSELTTDKIIPIGFKTNEVAYFEFDFSNVESLGNMCSSIYFKDNETGAILNLANNSKYQFISDVTDNTNRFSIQFVAGANAISEEAGNGMYIYGKNNQIIFNSNETLNGIATVYDILGNIIVSQNMSNVNNTVTINAATNYYIVKYTTDKKTITKRIFINK